VRPNVGVWMLSTGLASLQPPQLASRHVTHALTAAVESARCDGVAHRCHPANRQQEALATKQARMHAGTHAHSPTTIATMQHMRFPHCEHAQRCSGPGCCLSRPRCQRWLSRTAACCSVGGRPQARACSWCSDNPSAGAGRGEWRCGRTAAGSTLHDAAWHENKGMQRHAHVEGPSCKRIGAADERTTCRPQPAALTHREDVAATAC
jgi:hypothetical protein